MKSLETPFTFDAISVFDDTFLERVYSDRMASAGCCSIDEYRDEVAENADEKKALAESLYINYSEFFRNPLTFAVLEQTVIPLLLKKITRVHRGELRIWSAGCASGQEPYSVAMILEDLLKDRTDVSYRIFATDINERQVAGAKEGVYQRNALEKVPLSRIHRWFRLHPAGYTVMPELGNRIDFSVFDLLADSKNSPPSSIFGSFDIVLCCNLLLYFKPLYRKLMLNKLARSLRRGAFLVSGESERGFVMENGFHEVFPQSAVYQAYPLPRGAGNDD